MLRKGMTINDAAHQWVSEFNAIPYGICEKLLSVSPDSIIEVTPIAIGSNVIVDGGEYDGETGEVTGTETRFCTVKLDGRDEPVEIDRDYLYDLSERQDVLPMWGTLWSFGDSLDNYWLENLGGIQIMADCGFRIYEQEDYGYIFGIDGAGYSFYDEHWIPLYKARGLKWHDPESEGAS